MKKIAAILLTFLISIFSVWSQAASLPPATNGQVMSSLSGILKHIMPAVVNVAAQGEILPPENPFAEPGSNTDSPFPRPRRFESLASGVIVDAENGYILTNAHVLRDVKTISITLGDGRVFKAKLIGIDPPSDIAVLQIKADKLVAAQLGNSDTLKVGDFVAAIGNPFGLSQTVTSGIVSGLERSGLGIEGYENFIQTDASINPGNSGGALVNLQGQLIGINTAILAPSGGNIGIGFAIPINMARSVMAQLIKYGSVKRGLMGVYVQDLTPALANALNIPNQVGALVAQVAPASPAANAGIRVGDIIQEVDNKAVQNGEQVRNFVGLLRVGSQVTLKVLRTGKTITITLITADPEQYAQAYDQKNHYLNGLGLRDFRAQVPSQGLINGVQVLGIPENSAAWVAGLRAGDVILSANQIPVTQIEELQKIAHESKEELLLNILQRNGGASFILIK